MIVFQRVGVAVPGKISEAHTYVRNRSSFLKEAFGLDTTVSLLIGGQSGTISLSSSHENLGELEEVRGKIVVDPRSIENQAGAVGLFVPGETKDMIWTVGH